MAAVLQNPGVAVDRGGDVWAVCQYEGCKYKWFRTRESMMDVLIGDMVTTLNKKNRRGTAGLQPESALSLDPGTSA